MMNKEQLKTRREQLVNRVNELVEQIPALQREETAIRGQIQLISELLGDIPAPPGAAGELDADKPNGKPKKRGKAAAHG